MSWSRGRKKSFAYWSRFMLRHSNIMKTQNLLLYFNSSYTCYPVQLVVCDKDIKSQSFSWNLRWDDTLSEDQGSGSRAIYNGGWVVLKCSANYHLCIFSLGLRGLWVLWAACQRWNRKEKCSWKRMRRLRAPDLWNSSLQMKCTLPPGLFFPSIFSISCYKKKKYLAHNLRCVIKAMGLNCWRERSGMSIASLQHKLIFSLLTKCWSLYCPTLKKSTWTWSKYASHISKNALDRPVCDSCTWIYL